MGLVRFSKRLWIKLDNEEGERLERSVGRSGGYLGPPVMEGQFSSLHVRVRQSGSESITVAYTWYVPLYNVDF